MIVFTDAFTDDELFSDSFPQKTEFGGFIINVSSKMMKKDDDEDILYDRKTFDAMDNKPDNVIDVDQVVETFRLQELTSIAKIKDCVATITPYLTALKKKIQTNKGEDALKSFNEELKKFLMDQVGKDFSNYKFYMGESMDTDNGMVVFQKYNDDGETTQLYFFADGLKQIKC
ncbi:predicted protein [Naegleria gruberi]|uniref:Predicted protein n=1 Tax=Naegleria gruberi TaxID=5762 RepID=D2VID0_NAEGR|nr:uncharacterized protein NAEGRDRAFT_80074 [Naegleria gruberi]EFC43574.1 predicted protein [Naegleria gruberi]|eukprot:XP_002676318.1 predicted protein [Naegleria gruberi strain NEG-M]